MNKRDIDLKLIDGFLNNNIVAYNKVEEFVDTALLSWRGRFGYQTDDIKSDVIYKLLKSLTRGDYSQKSSLKAYIGGTVNHTCIDYFRYNQRFTDDELSELRLPSLEPTPEEAIEKKQLARLIFRVFRLIPRECRKMWRMYLKEDKNCREIGEALGKAEGNIRRRLWECRKKAREIREKILKNDKLL